MDKSLQQELVEKTSFIRREMLYEGRVFSLRKDTMHCSDHKVKEWDIVVHPGAVAILPITSEKKIVFIKQWRRAAERILIEIPAGTLEKEEPPLCFAQRELREETGFSAHTFLSLGGFFTAPGFCTEYLHLFLAQDLEYNPLLSEDTDYIDPFESSLEEALEMIAQGIICDAKTVIAVMRYQKWLEKTLKA